MAEVRVIPNLNDAYNIELWKGTKRLKDMKFTKGEWEELEDKMEKIKKPRISSSLDEALNMGDGVYRP